MLGRSRSLTASASRLGATLARPAALRALPATSVLASKQPPLLQAATPTRSHERELSSRPLQLPGAPKMGTLAVDPLAASSTVQGVEYVLTGFDKLVNWARKSSLWPMTFGLA